MLCSYCLIFLYFAVGASQHSCIEEFGTCAVQRDCCPNLKCVTGDWQYTTDSTCLSPRSEAVEWKAREYSKDDKISVLIEFYQNIESGSSQHKSKEDIEKIVRRYDNEFPKLISKLEQKYQVQFDKFEPDSGSTTRDEM